MSECECVHDALLRINLYLKREWNMRKDFSSDLEQVRTLQDRHGKIIIIELSTLIYHIMSNAY